LPGKLRVAQPFQELRIRVELLDRRRQGDPPLRRVDVAGELEDGRIVQHRVPLEVPAGREDEQGPPERRTAFDLVQCDLLARDIRENDEVGVVSRRGQVVYSSAIASASSSTPMPSSISSRVIVSGGQTMMTFQCVIR
jgi:hypothetical protein